MSEELQNQINTLSAENESLKNQVAQNNVGINSLLAQLEAHKQQLNESITVGLNLRTNLLLFQQKNQELLTKLEEHK